MNLCFPACHGTHTKGARATTGVKWWAMKNARVTRIATHHLTTPTGLPRPKSAAAVRETGHRNLKKPGADNVAARCAHQGGVPARQPVREGRLRLLSRLATCIRAKHGCLARSPRFSHECGRMANAVNPDALDSGACDARLAWGQRSVNRHGAVVLDGVQRLRTPAMAGESGDSQLARHGSPEKEAAGARQSGASSLFSCQENFRGPPFAFAFNLQARPSATCRACATSLLSMRSNWACSAGLRQATISALRRWMTFISRW